MELHHSLRPESGGRRHFQTVHFMKPMAAIGNGGIDIVVDPHSIQTEKREMFYLFGTLGIGAAVFHMGLRSKRKSLVKCRLAYFGDWNRSQRRANPCFHSERIENIGFMSVTVNEAVGIHFPVNGHQRDRVVIVVQVSGHAERKLFHGIEAGDRTGFFSRRIQCGKKQSCKNRNNRDRYKDNLSNILICSILAMTRKKSGRRIEQ